MKRSTYFKQAELLLRVLPAINEEKYFALKGGTALNFFVLDMPRLSVDIDLAFLSVIPRDEALRDIDAALNRIGDGIKRLLPDARVERSKAKDDNRVVKLLVIREGALIKIEPNEVIRGTVFPCKKRNLVEAAEDLFELSVGARILSVADLYGGKFCAALDRQHPRDLFDVKMLLDGEGITDDIRKAFVIYLASHNRPMNELLSPNWQEIRPIFESDFRDITSASVTCDELVDVRDLMHKKLLRSLTDDERRFLISVKNGDPEWNLIAIDGIEKLPAIQWKVQNVRRMPAEKKARELEKLRRVLKI